METPAKEKDRLVHEFDQVVATAEELLKSAAASGGEKAQAVREEVARSLEAWRERIAGLEQQAAKRARAAADDTDRYVHDHPWQAVGVATAVGALAGAALGLILGRSR